MAFKQRSFKSKVYTVAIYFLLYIAILAFPFSRWLSADISSMIAAILKLSLFGYLFANLEQNGFRLRWFDGRAYWLLPCFILCGSNLFILPFSGVDIAEDVNWTHLVCVAVTTIGTVLCEEFVFRGMLIEVLKEKYSDEISLVLSSLAFGFAHFILYVWSNPFLASVQMGYTVFLGLVTGFIYLGGGGIHYALAIHFAFNMLNDAIFPRLYGGSMDTRYYLVNVMTGSIVLAYMLALYFWNKKKKSS